MPEAALLPDPVLRVLPPPHVQGQTRVLPIQLTFLLATAVALAAGVTLFGWATIRVAGICIAVTLLVEAGANVLLRRGQTWGQGHALLTGALLACTLPPMTPWHVAAVAAVVAIVVGQILSGGSSGYLWHPVALGRVAVQLLFPGDMTPSTWPVLAPGRLVWGDLSASAPLPHLGTWSSANLPAGAEAWRTIRPLDSLQQTLSGGTGGEAIAGLIRDHLPPWADTLLGLSGGAVGEACVLALFGAGLLLMWRGLLRWPAVVSAVVAAAMLASVLPVRMLGPSGPAAYWLPGSPTFEGMPVGLVYVAYVLTAGEFPLCLLLLASDPGSSPRTTRGHILFGWVIGAMTVLLGVGVGIPAAGYWALLAGNTLVPAINRVSRRRVFGT
jgi:Na+-translocating ferredoxin:NAD+ oxidoreductase subunit D